MADASILFRDKFLVAADKPPRLETVVEGKGEGDPALCFTTLLRQALDLPGLAPGHRLDRDTSGCLLLAKTRPAMLALQRMLREGKMEKHYVALVSGAWRGGTREVSVALEKNRPHAGEHMVEVTEDGKVLPMDVKPGDRILYGKYSGNEIKIDDVEHLIMHQDDILGILK